MQSKQVKRQCNTPLYIGSRPLDFSPFTAALQELSDVRRAELAGWLIEADIPSIQTHLDSGGISCRELAFFIWIVSIRTNLSMPSLN